MYLIGKVKSVVDGQTVAWDPVRLCMTRHGAEKHCPTMEYFHLRIGFKKVDDKAEPVFPRRIKE